MSEIKTLSPKVIPLKIGGLDYKVNEKAYHIEQKLEIKNKNGFKRSKSFETDELLYLAKIYLSK